MCLQIVALRLRLLRHTRDLIDLHLTTLGRGSRGLVLSGGLRWGGRGLVLSGGLILGWLLRLLILGLLVSSIWELNRGLGWSLRLWHLRHLGLDLHLSLNGLQILSAGWRLELGRLLLGHLYLSGRSLLRR